MHNTVTAIVANSGSANGGTINAPNSSPANAGNTSTTGGNRRNAGSANTYASKAAANVQPQRQAPRPPKTRHLLVIKPKTDGIGSQATRSTFINELESQASSLGIVGMKLASHGSVIVETSSSANGGNFWLFRQ